MKFLDGDLVFDIDYTSVEFRGQIEQTTPADQVSLNENGFTAYVQNACPGTIVDWDNERKHGDPDLAALTQEQFRTSSYTSPQDLACRRNAALSWLQSGANAGSGELSFAGGALERGRDGSPLLLRYVEGAWTAQGSREAETVIYGVRYGFELPDNRWTNWIGEDKGAFLFTLSATQFLTQSLTKFKSFGCDAAGRNEGGFCIRDHVLAGITADGVGNRNSQYFSPPNMHLMSDLPPTPEFRAQASLRWFNGPHTAQLMVRWHDSVTNVNVAWDAMKEREAPGSANSHRVVDLGHGRGAGIVSAPRSLPRLYGSHGSGYGHRQADSKRARVSALRVPAMAGVQDRLPPLLGPDLQLPSPRRIGLQFGAGERRHAQHLRYVPRPDYPVLGPRAVPG